MSRRARALLVASLVGALAFLATAGVGAQNPSQGVITGEVAMGTAGAELDAGLVVQFIVLGESGVTGTLDVPAPGGQFSVEVPLDPSVQYVQRAIYEGVQYFGESVRLTPEAPRATVAPLVVYAATEETPELSLAQTIVTVVALDLGRGELGLVREDLVVNPSDRVYVGRASNVTLRLPAPDGTVEAAGENPDGRFTLQDGIVTTTVPIRAMGETGIVTRYLVEYEPAGDRYVLRVTVPIPTDRIVVRVPESFARSLEPQSPATAGEGELLAIGDAEPVPLRTVVLEGAGPGESLIVVLDGLSPRLNENPLTEAPGSIIAGAVALVVIAAATTVFLRLGRRPSA